MTLNPIFWFVLFALGYVFGLLLKNPTGGKFLIFGFLGIVFYQPIRDAGLLASALFLIGVLSHHLNFLSFMEDLPRWFARRRQGGTASRQRNEEQQTHSQANPQGSESAEQTNARYEEYVRRNRQYGAESEPEKKACRSKRKKPQPEAGGNSSTSEAELRREKIRVKQEQERQTRERERLQEERDQLDRERRASKPADDTRTPQQILGLSDEYTLTELKQARNAEVKRWNTSNMRHKPQHLIQQAEEEAKKINLAYEQLVKKFR